MKLVTHCKGLFVQTRLCLHIHPYNKLHGEEWKWTNEIPCFFQKLRTVVTENTQKVILIFWITIYKWV